MLYETRALHQFVRPVEHRARVRGDIRLALRAVDDDGLDLLEILDRQLHGQAIYPPINVLPSLSRLMKDGIGAGYTREDHQDVANQLFSCYAKVGDARALASVIGEDELSPLDKTYLKFGQAFEHTFVGQGEDENRSIVETLDLGWKLLRMLPREELDRIDTKILDKYYNE